MRFLASAVVLLCALAPSTHAQITGGVEPNPNVRITYGRVTNPDSPAQGVRRRLEEGRVLERLREFLSPLRLPRDLTIMTETCGQDRKRYRNGSAQVTICYELVGKLEEAAAKVLPDNPKGQRDTVVGAFVHAALHEVAHAVFDIYQIPVWGRMDDAADRLAALIMVMFGEDAAVTTILGTLDALEGKAQPIWMNEAFASLESPEQQRRFNFMCVAAAADQLLFKFLQNFIPKQRIGFCVQEYQQIRKAFNLRIMPHVDPERLVLIRTKRWLP
jgi:hypothetical protein